LALTVSQLGWIIEKPNKQQQKTAVLLKVSTFARAGMFCGAKHTHHTFILKIKHQQQHQTLG